MARTSGPNGPGPSGCASRPDARASTASRDEAMILGQLYPSPRAMPKTAAPNTWPTGSNPTLRIAANSLEVSAESHVLLARIPATRASAAPGGSSCTTQSYTHHHAHRLRPLTAHHPRPQAVSHGENPVDDPGRRGR